MFKHKLVRYDAMIYKQSRDRTLKTVLCASVVIQLFYWTNIRTAIRSTFQLNTQILLLILIRFVAFVRVASLVCDLLLVVIQFFFGLRLSKSLKFHLIF